MNTERSAIIEALLKKYQSGTCTPEEKIRVETWLENINHQPNQDTDALSEEFILRRIRKQVLGQIDATPLTRYAGLYYYLKIAAALLLIPTTFILYFNWKKTQTITYQQYTTARGERKILTLPDSTTVVLNASSVLEIGDDFGKKNRFVKLSGEGYFHVKHNASKPFVVATGHIQTRVLGTQFNVHAYANEANYKIAVVSGRVRVGESSSNNKVTPLGNVLTRNVVLVYNKNTHSHFIKNADADKISAWQNGELYFDEASIPEIALALSRKYNVNVGLMGKPGHNCKYTIGFNGQPLDKVLRVLNELTGLTYEYAQNKIIIHSQNCH